MSGYEVTSRARAAWSVESQIRNVARDVFGADLVEQSIGGMNAVTRPGVDEPLAGIRAAVLARDVAKWQMRKYAEQARGVGRSWDQIAEAVGIEQDENEGPRGEQAYLLLIAGLGDDLPVWSLHPPTASWTCTSCGQRVDDSGPFNHPSDNEDGHAAGCARHAAEVAAYREEWA